MSTEVDIQELEEDVRNALKTVYDPEIPVDVYELGLIYEMKVREDRSVYVQMTLTTPNCPVAEILPNQVKQAVAMLDWVTDVELDLTFDPPFHRDMMSDAAKLELGFL